MRKKSNKGVPGDPMAKMPEMGPAMKMDHVDKSMDMTADKDFVQVKKHRRHKAGGTQPGHPAKGRQPSEMRYIERD